MADIDDDDIVYDEDNPDWTTVRTAALDAAAKLKVIRVELAMSQQDFAALLHIPKATLANWEQRRTEPDAFAVTMIGLIYDDPKGMTERLRRKLVA